ncbi:MAG: hypothetical protein ACI4EC_07290 [Lachnospiraceae bacterium]
MSLKVSGERLLAEALADAMDRDLAGVPPREQLEQQHRFSKKFVRRMKRLERAASDNREIPTTVNSSEKSDAKERKTVDFRRLGAAAKRYSGLAAAFICVIGLAAVVGVMSRSLRMGKSSTAEGIAESATADTAAPEEAWDDVAGEPSAEAAEEAAGSETPENNAPNSITDNGTPEDEKGEQAMVPDWQEQLLLESAKADELVTWHLNMIYDDGSIGLTSDVVNPSDSSVATPGQSLYVSGVFEVYYEQRPDEWDCIYRTKRTRDNYSAATSWDEWYALDELHMTQAGTYRLVRQVNSYRQVLQLTLDER